MLVKNKEGMTLIELIIALAIIGIASVSFLTFFTQGFKFVTKAGDRSKAGFNAQAQAEKALNNGISTSNVGSLTITFSDNTYINLDATYGYISSQTTSPAVNGSQTTITFFKPN